MRPKLYSMPIADQTARLVPGSDDAVMECDIG